MDRYTHVSVYCSVHVRPRDGPAWSITPDLPTTIVFRSPALCVYSSHYVYAVTRLEIDHPSHSSEHRLPTITQIPALLAAEATASLEFLSVLAVTQCYVPSPFCTPC